MLEQTTAQAAALAPPVPAVGAQWLGLARDLRRRVGVEDVLYDQTVAELIAPLKERLRRYPNRSLRPEMLATLVQSWRFMAPRDWRLDLDAKLDKHRLALVEHRLVAGRMRPLDDPGWIGFEHDVAVIRIELRVNRSTAQLASRCVAAFSLHAVARRLQRGLDGDIAAVLHDMQLVAQAARGALVVGAGYRVRTDDHGGGWRGRVIRQSGAGTDGTEQPVLAIRTWLAT